MRVMILCVRSTAILASTAGLVLGQTTIRVSLGPAGAQANGPSYYPRVSASGRFVAFQSNASNLVPRDTNGAADIFVRDLLAGTTVLASVNAAGVQGDAESEYAWLSADGRRVAFYSEASNLVPGDTNGLADVFVRDLVAKTTTLVSADSSGMPGDLESTFPALSADGRHVVFWSLATNLVHGDTNGAWDIFVRDLHAGTTTRVNVATGGAQSGGDDSFYGKAPAISADGLVVAFVSLADDLVPLDTNNVHDVFVHDRVDGTTTRVSVGPGGLQGNRSCFTATPTLSADGRFVCFASLASNLVSGDTNRFEDAFVHDRPTSTTSLASLASSGAQSEGGANTPTLSPDGRFIAFKSSSSNLAPGDTTGWYDVFVRDLVRGATARVSVSLAGTEGNQNSGGYPSPSAGGGWVAFHSAATNLVPSDTNGFTDVFVRFYGRRL